MPNDGILSGSPRLRLVLNVLARFFRIWRIAFLIESALLVFNAPFDFSNLAPHDCWSPLQLSLGADQLFIILSNRTGLFQNASVGALAKYKLLFPKFARDSSSRIFHEYYNAMRVEA
jgi:hypothetical protein